MVIPVIPVIPINKSNLQCTPKIPVVTRSRAWSSPRTAIPTAVLIPQESENCKHPNSTSKHQQSTLVNLKHIWYISSAFVCGRSRKQICMGRTGGAGCCAKSSRFPHDWRARGCSHPAGLKVEPKPSNTQWLCPKGDTDHGRPYVIYGYVKIAIENGHL
jgi:hypothetical protein